MTAATTSTAYDLTLRLDELEVPIFVAPAGTDTEFVRPVFWSSLTADGNSERIAAYKTGAAVCAVCGEPLAVVDVDPRNGGDADAIRRLLAGLGVVVFAEVATPGGGRHFYVAGHPELPTVHGTADRPGLIGYPGVDLQSHGSNVFLPGTRRPKYDGRGYQIVYDNLAALGDGGDPNGASAFISWVAEHRTVTAEPYEPAPQWDGTPPDARQRAYLSAALTRQAEQIAAMGPDSGRNTALYTAALKLGSFVAGAGLDEASVIEVLTAAATSCRLVADDGASSVAASIRSGLRNGRTRPQAVPPPAELPAGDDPSLDDEQEARAPRKSQASRLVALALDRYRVLLGDDGRPYAVALDGPNIARPLRGRSGLREQLAKRYADANGGTVPSATALADALTVLDGHARDCDPEPVALRLAAHGDGIVIDLGTADGRCVQVDPTGWRVLSTSPVLFRRTALTSPLPDPQPGGSLEVLRGLLNADDDGWHLLLGWCLAAMLPGLPHPVLALLGEQGTAKSTAARLLVNLLDPSPAPLRSCPRDLRQWAVAASASWTVALDNVSSVQPWLSDVLCRAVTGDGIVDRALYTDDDVSVLSFRRVVAMTSIDAGALSGDLAERLLPIELARIPTDARRTEADIDAAFIEARPPLFGALLDLLVKVLAALPDVRLAELPRMADFARVLAALDQVLGCHTLKSYADAATHVAETVVESDPFAEAVRGLAKNGWSGTATELLDKVIPDKPPRGWPRSARGASGALRRVVPALRTTGVEVTFEQIGKAKSRNITIAESADGADANDPSDGHSHSISGPDLARPHPADGADANPMLPSVPVDPSSRGEPPDPDTPERSGDRPSEPSAPSATRADLHKQADGWADANDADHCSVCSKPLAPALLDQGRTAHPSCEGEAA